MELGEIPDVGPESEKIVENQGEEDVCDAHSGKNEPCQSAACPEKHPDAVGIVFGVCQPESARKRKRRPCEADYSDNEENPE